ncbi:prepilin peptidase [Nocardioides sp. GY 10113]|nr:prepilin peptidase [Nocardioides sp. GY 10113]
MIPLVAGALGLVVGSFLNVVVHRVPVGASVVTPGSACPGCTTPIRARHNVPVLGWLMLRGRCYDCAAPISARYPLVEAGTGLAFVLVTHRVLALDAADGAIDQIGVLPAYLVFCALAIALSVIDLETRRLPDALVLPAYPLLAGLLLLGGGEANALLRALVGGAGLALLYFAIWFAAPGGMGFGDVKLSGIVGAMTAYLSWGTFLVGAFGAFVLGAIAGILLIVTDRAGRRSALPFGPFMLLAAWAAILGAGQLGDWYLHPGG